MQEIYIGIDNYRRIGRMLLLEARQCDPGKGTCVFGEDVLLSTTWDTILFCLLNYNILLQMAWLKWCYDFLLEYIPTVQCGEFISVRFPK